MDPPHATASTTSLPAVLDAAQLVRIQSAHRGFLYQHVYAVICVLSAPWTAVEAVRVERDEDVELVRHGETVYAQIKTRSEPLAPSDIDGLFERFDALRDAHRSGLRAGAARFALIANVPLGPTLANRPWPSDVIVLTPASAPATAESAGLHVPASDIDALLAQAVSVAENHRLSALRPASLVSKLVGLVAAAAASVGSHSLFATTDLHRFCEHVAAQLRPLPVITDYRPQALEPDLPARGTVLAVHGHSGEGKSAWAAHVAAHSAEVAVYVPCSSTPGEQLAPRLLDAAVAAVAARGTVHAHDLVLPGRTGLDALALFDTEILRRGRSLLAIIDDCHNAAPAAIVEAVRAAPNFRWVLLGHPCDGLSEAAASLGVTPRSLGGWDEDTIARLLAESGCSASPRHVADLRRVTGGAPLFVVHAVRAIREGDRDTGSYAHALGHGTTPGRPSQEAILDRVVRGLSPDVGRVASALAAVDLSLTGAEWAKELAPALGLPEAVALRAVRAAVDIGVASATEGSLVYLLDAFRPLLADRFVSDSDTRAIRERLAAFLRSQLLHERAGERITAYVRILAALGRMSDLSDLANAISEWIRETGTTPEVRAHLEAALASDTLALPDRFWALDTLTFFDVDEGHLQDAAARLPLMRALVDRAGADAHGALMHKEAIVALKRCDFPALRAVVASCPSDHRYARILRYHGALGEGEAGNIPVAIMMLLGVAEEYLAEVGLTPKGIFATGPAELVRLMSPTADVEHVRHLADCYHAISRFASRSEVNEHHNLSGIFTIWAMKFYDIAGATRSALSVGQDWVDVVINLWNEPATARKFLEESLLPAAAGSRMPDVALHVRAQYAVVCALTGDYGTADAEMGRLQPYVAALPPSARAEVHNQIQLVARLRADASRKMLPRGKVGRNERCPCGSGSKFKKCCGS